MIVEELQKAVRSALEHIGIEASEVLVEHPADLTHGDYSTNVALVYAKHLKIKPRELAEKILERLNLESAERLSLEKIETAGVGFINFRLSKEFFVNAVKTIGDDFGKNDSRKGEKIFFEYTQPNPFKEFHIGHLMNNTLGEAISRVLEQNGAKLKRATYHGDVGLHVAKSIWGVQKLNPKTLDVPTLGKAYAMGNDAYETDTIAKQDIIILNKALYTKNDAALIKLYEEGRAISLKYFEALYKRLGSSFDLHFFESEAGEVGKKIVLENVGRVFEKSEGAIVYKGEQDGLHTRVFLNSEGLPTYEAKEVGLANMKRKKFAYDHSVTVTANEQDDFFKVVEKAIEKIFPELKGKLLHLSHGMLKLPAGKMSSRTGTVISAESLIEQVKKMVQEKIKGRDMTEAEKEKVAEQVAIGAIKYSILRQAIGGDIVFDFEKSISFEGDSGPYLQYACVRAKSVLRKAGSSQDDIFESPRVVSSHSTRHFKQVSRSEPILLERLLYRFPEVVERAGNEYEPHYVVTYLTELAAVFNGWYAQEQIVSKDDPASPYKVALTEAFATTMKNGLWLLGIEVPEKM